MAKSRRTRKRNDHKATVGDEPGPDISLLSRPTATSVKGLRDVLKAFEEGTPEVHHLLSNECEIVYECRVCRSLYRSFLNFITHKRIYCQQQYTSGSPKVSHFFNDVLDEDETVVVHNEPARFTRQSVGEVTSHRDIENAASTSSAKPKQLPRKNLTEILGLLSQKASSTDGLQRLVSSDGFTALNSLITDAGSDQAAPGFKGRIPRQHLLQLESLESTDVAIRQTVTLGPDGKILANNVATAVCTENDLSPGSNDPSAVETKLVCTKCDSQFSNSKTYKHHVTFVHDPARFFYLCPCCKSKFSNSWSVHRHLKSVHNKTTEQMRRLREQIQRVHKWEPANDKPSKAAAKQNPINNEDLEQEKLYNERQSEMEVFEKEYNKCSGCNRSFDRLAAFNYHVRNCSRRIMALNTNLKVKKTPLARKETLLVKPSEPAIASKLQPLGDSTGESSAQCNDESADLKPRQRQNSEKRLEPAATKKIEIQLRRDYNKITAAPMNEDDEQENMPAGQEELSPTSINKIVASLVDYSKSLPAVPSSNRRTNGEDGDAGSEQNCESVVDSASYNGETPLRGNSRETSISPISIEEQVVGSKNSSSGNRNRLNMNWEQLSSNGSKSTSPSEDDDILLEESGNLSDCSYRPMKRMRRPSGTDGIPSVTRMVNRPTVTIIKMKQNQSKSESEKSILKGILSNEHGDSETSIAPEEDEMVQKIEVDDTPRSDGIDVMRTSVKDWNGFEENFRGFEEPVAKRIKAHEDLDICDYDDSLSSPSFDYNDFDDSEDDFDDHDDQNEAQMCLETANDESCQIQTEPENNVFVQEVSEKAVPISVTSEATVCPPMQIAFRGHYGQVFQLLSCPDEGRITSIQQVPIPIMPAVNSENNDMKVEEVPSSQDADHDQEDSGINVFKSNTSGKADVDEDILKVIFEEEDLTQAASMHFKKGTIIMGNGTFSLGTSGAAHEGVNEEGERPTDDTQRRWATGGGKVQPQRRNSLEARPKSAMDSKDRSVYPSMPRRNSSSNDGDFKLDSGAEITPSSSMENLFPKTRPVRNRAKVHSTDFIYDLSDEVVSEGILSTSKPYQVRTEVQDELADKKKVMVTDMNPQVMLVRTEDMLKTRPARVKSNSVSELPLEETMNNNSTGCNLVNSIRKSVRAQVTKL